MTDTVMPRAQRAYLIAVCAVIAGAFAYGACEWGRWPRLVFAPLGDGWSLASQPSPTTTSYLGVVAWGVSGAICGAAVGAILSRVFDRPWRESTLRLFGAWAIAAILLCGAYFTWSLRPW